MTWDELNQIIQRHGGALSDPVIVDPEIDNPSPAGRELHPKIANPNPTYRYNLKDGKFFTAKATQTGEGEGQTTFQVVDPGTAVQPLTPADRLPSPTSQLEKIDANGDVIPPGDTTGRRAAKLRDQSTGAVTDLPDPKTSPEGTVKEFGNQLLLIKPDGTFSVIASTTDAAKAPTLHSGPNGSLIEYDPSKPAGQRVSVAVAAPPDKTKPVTETRNGVTYQWDPATNSWSEAAGLPSEKKPTSIYGTGPNDQFRITVDDQGNEVSRVKNPNYVEPKPTQLTPDTVSANIPLLKPDGTVDFQPNRNQVTVSQAMSDLLGQVGVKVNAGQMSMADAKDMLTGAVNAMNARTAQDQNVRGAAGDILTATTAGAQTGAGMLNQRVSAGQGMLTSALNLAGQRPMVGLAPGAGQALMQDIQGFTTQLGGGQGVYDTAARLVQAADPSGGTSPMAHAAYGVITQMLDRYRQTAGEPHPYEQATAALQQSQQTNGMAAPGAAPLLSPQAPVSGNPVYASGGPGPVLAGQFTAPPLVAAGQPAPLATNTLTNLDPRLRGAIY